MSCCPNPVPRIAERSGRMFCASCRTYLDNGPRKDTDGSRVTETPWTRSPSPSQDGPPEAVLDAPATKGEPR